MVDKCGLVVGGSASTWMMENDIRLGVSVGMGGFYMGLYEVWEGSCLFDERMVCALAGCRHVPSDFND